MLGVLSTPLFLWLNRPLFGHYQTLITLDNNISTESILEQCIETVLVLICKTQRVSFCSNCSTSPNNNLWYLQLGKKHILASWWAMQYSLITIYFSEVMAELKGCVLNTLHKSWESLVALQLPSDCWVVFWSNYFEKQDTTTFCTNLLKRERNSKYGKVTWQWPKNRPSSYM